MCIYRLFIFTTCGHFLFSPGPLLTCTQSSPSSYTSRHAPQPQPCIPRGHPFTSRFLDRRCASCTRQCAQEERERRARLEEVLAQWTKDVRVEEARWRIHFGEKSSFVVERQEKDTDVAVMKRPGRFESDMRAMEEGGSGKWC